MSISNTFLNNLIERLKNNFKSRLLLAVFVGSQSTENANEFSESEISIVLDSVNSEDFISIKNIIQNFDEDEEEDIYPYIFMRSLQEIKAWPKNELTSLYLGSTVLYGNLSEIIPEINDNDVKEDTKKRIADIIYTIRNTIIYDEEEIAVEAARGLFKAGFFVIQNIYYLKNRIIINSINELKNKTDEKSADILDIYENWFVLKNERKNNPSDILNVLERWSSEQLNLLETL